MKNSVLKFATLPLLAGALAISGHGQAGRGRTVEAAGCVWEGVEAGCLMVTDRETDNTYNLLISSGEKPSPGTGIFFMGTLHEGATSCMQGRPVDVKSWVKRKNINCSAPEKKRPNPY
jgi:hypothetical protein